MATKYLKSLKFPDLPDTYEVVQPNGYYEDLTSGSTEEVISNVKITDQEPYTFRTSGGNAEIGSREEDTLVGVSVAFNQLVQNFSTDYWVNESGTTSSFSDGIATVTTTVNSNGIRTKYSNYVEIHNGHKYLLSVDVKSATEYSNVSFGLAGAGLPMMRKNVAGDSAWHTCASIIPSTVDSTTGTVYFFRSAATMENVQAKNPMVFDLTLAFGSDIADYLYTLETAQAGEGVALAKKLGLNKYLGYNAGTLYSAQTDAHKMVGFNLLGTLNRTSVALSNQQYTKVPNIGEDKVYYGLNTGFLGRPAYVTNVSITEGGVSWTEATTSGYGVSFPVKCLPNMTYYKKATLSNCSLVMAFLDAEGNKISVSNDGTTGKTFTTPSNCYWILVMLTAMATGTCSATDICISIHWDNSRDTDYEPYVLHNYPIDPVVLLGELHKDADGNIYADGDTYETDGTVTRKRAKIVFSSDITINPNAPYRNGNGVWCAAFGLIAENLAKINGSVICDKIASLTNKNYTSADADGLVSPVYATSVGIICLTDSTSGLSASSTNAEVATALASYLNARLPLTVQYELAEPTTEQATPFTTPQIVDNWGTEEYPDYAVAQGSRAYSVPMGHKTLYPISIRDKVEASADNPSNDGDYILHMSGGKATYTPLIIEDELPQNPTTDGTYSLKMVISNGVATRSWIAE